MSEITKEQREKFIADYASRIVEEAGWTAKDAMLCALACDVDQTIADGWSAIDAADEEMSYWENDGD